MSGNVACSCGYRGPGIADGLSVVCPICRTPAAAVERAYRIPCPNGHVLKARDEWLGREMVCPTCNEPFVLRATDSLEYRKEQKLRQDAADARQAQVWLKRAIFAGVIVVLSFVVMVVLSMNPQWFQPKS
ncbi:MAG: hypothetical protein K8S94_01100 [Planctomycetia bacterium]|nr:hypothetical protein [Planctomycetia bacterium]